MLNTPLLQFLKASGRIGGGSVIFALVLFAFAIWEHLAEKNVSAAWLVGCGLTFFCYGGFKAWSDEAHNVASLTARLDSQLPHVTLGIPGGLSVYHKEKDRHVFILAVAIGNAGAATSIDHWSATYEIGDSKEPMTFHHLRSDGLTVMLKRDTKTFYQSEMLNFILSGKQLERRQQVTGRVLYTVPGDRTSQTNSCSYRIRLSCFDFDGRETTALYSPAAQSSEEIFYFPHEEAPVKNLTGEVRHV